MHARATRRGCFYSWLQTNSKQKFWYLFIKLKDSCFEQDTSDTRLQSGIIAIGSCKLLDNEERMVIYNYLLFIDV